MTLSSGTRLGPYEILAPLGAGGMGEVYRARDGKLDREVAVKVLPAQLTANADALARFEREAKAVAALSHPNILAIHDFGSHEGVSYAVTELLEGETLRGKLDGSTVTQKQAVDWGLQVAKGLSAAHGKGGEHEKALDNLEALLKIPYVSRCAQDRPELRPAAQESEVSEARRRREVVERYGRTTMRRLACLGLGLAALTAGCLSNRATTTPDGTGGPPGAFTLTRAGAPPIALSTAACVSGERQQFLGADFSDEAAGYTVRLVVDPLSGPAARVFSNAHPFDDSTVFRRSDCRVFHFAVDSTGWRIDHDEDYRISLELDCAGDRVSLAGKAAAEHCH